MRLLRRAVSCVVFAFVVAYASHVVIVVVGPDVGDDHDGCAVVLGAGVDVDVPSAVFAGRLDAAVDVVNAGVVDVVVFTGGTGAGDTASEADAGAAYVNARAEHPFTALRETASTTTAENLRFARPLLEAKGRKRCLLISDDLHLARALSLADAAGLDVVALPTPHSAFTSTSTRLPMALREAWYLLKSRFSP